MNVEEKCKLAIEKGYSYNPETGEVKNKFGKISKTKDSHGYYVIGLYPNGKRIVLKHHQFAWYYTYKESVKILDHINGIRDDNRISNLRSLTKQQNHFNTKAKGYCWHKTLNKWKSQIMYNYKSIHLGYFDTEEDARKAYLKAKLEYHRF